MKLKARNTTIAADIKQFKLLVQQGVDAWVMAGKVLVKALKDNPEAYDRFLGEGITHAHLSKFERIGKGELEPRLLLNGSIGYLKLQSVPESQQRRALDEGVKVYEPSASGETTHRMIQAEELNAFQASQVFAPSGIRTVQQQRAYLAERENRKNRTEAAKTVDLPDYTIKGTKVTFKAGCVLTLAQIGSIMAELTK